MNPSDTFLVALAVFLLLNIAAGLVRVWRGPTAPDRMLAAQLFGSTGTAILLLLAGGLHMPVLRDVALVLALLAASATVVFVQRTFNVRSDSTAGRRQHGS